MLHTPMRREFLRSAGAASLALALGAPAFGRQAAGDAPVDPLASIRSQLKDPSKPFTLVVRFTLKPGTYERVRPIFDAAAAGTAAEPGVVQYDFHQSPSNPNQFALLEQWRSLADLEAHIAQPYTAAALKALADNVDGQPVVELYQRVGDPARAPSTFASGFYRFSIGSIKATAVSDGFLEFSPIHPTWGPEVEKAELDRLLSSAFLSTERATAECTCLVLRMGGETVLIDTGCGTMFGPNLGRLGQNLEAAGIKPSDITAVVLTHAHPDHVGGLFDFAGKPMFPGAQLFLTKAEHDFWTVAPDLSAVAVPDEWKTAWTSGAQARLGAYKQRLNLVKPGDRILDGIEVLDTSGHTPGHASLLVSAGSESLLVTGDVLAHHVVGIEAPAIGTIFDTDRAKALSARAALLDRAATDRLRVFMFHGAWPGLGRIRRGSGAQPYFWVLEPMQW